MSLTIERVSYAEILGAANAAALIAEYAAECSIPEIGVISPQAEMYAAMEKSGNFQVFGAFDGRLPVGFAAPLTYLNPHYGRRIATMESVFLARTHRSGRAGNQLMNAAEEYGRERECEAMLYSAKKGSQFEKLMYLLKPYHPTHTVFMRSLLPRQKS